MKISAALHAAWKILLASGLAACVHPGHSVFAHGALGGIRVAGIGEAKGAPDLARTSIGVEVRAASVQDAMQQANAQMAALLQVLKQQGIAETDLRTHGFSVSYERDYAVPVAAVAPASEPATPARLAKKPGPSPEALAAADVATASPAPQRGSYVVRNQAEVTIRDVGKLGDVLSAATASGANNIWGINFDLSDKQPLLERARAQAFENAKQNAERLAELSGVKLGPLLAVQDGVADQVMPYGGGMMTRAAAGDAVPTESGELTISHQVSLHYAIEGAK